MQNKTIVSMTLTALFSALVFIGTTIKIPLPTGAFVHLGNAMFLLAVLLIGYSKGAIAGSIGFALFDLLNGYATEAPYFILECFIVGAVSYGAIKLCRTNELKLPQIIFIGAMTGIAKLVMTQLKNWLFLLLSGAGTKQAFLAASVKLPATLINVGTTILIVSLLYFPIRKLLLKQGLTSIHH